MKFKLLESKSLYSDRVCWRLATCNLYDYLSNLRKDFFDFDVQRRIVSNSYLDRIGESVDKGEPLPAFTLTSNSIDDGNYEINLDKTEILDGLQRTYRLWIILFIEQICKSNINFEDIYGAIKDSHEGQKMISVKLINRSKVRKLTENNCFELNRLIKVYKSTDIVLNIWSGLSDEEIIKKMLTLNAGQRSVSSTHQFELLFLHCFKNLKLPKEICIVREKDSNYGKVKRGDRKLGEFLMSSIVISLQSYIEQRPLRISQVNKVGIEDSIVQESSSDFFTPRKLEEFIQLIYKIDAETTKNTSLNTWLMKDTTLSGLFAAIGEIADSSLDFDKVKIQDCINKIDRNVNINEFEASYKKLSSASTNVGNAVRKAVFYYFRSLFKDSQISWSTAFNIENHVSF